MATEETSVRVFVNDAEDELTVTLQLVNPGMMEIDGQLCPVIEVDVQRALELAWAIVLTGEQIVKRLY